MEGKTTALAALALAASLLGCLCCTTGNPPATTTSTTLTQKPEKCLQMEENITRLIDQANHCETDADCLVPNFSPGCPFGCYLLANEYADLSSIVEATTAYQLDCPQCEYKCGPPPSFKEIECRQNKCVDTRFEPGDTTTTTRPEPTPNFDGNCTALEKQVETLIEEANYCTIDEECTVSGYYPGCPFGCYIFANKNASLAGIKAGSQEYHKNCPTCVYSCLMPPNKENLTCRMGRCFDSRFQPDPTGDLTVELRIYDSVYKTLLIEDDGTVTFNESGVAKKTRMTPQEIQDLKQYLTESEFFYLQPKYETTACCDYIAENMNITLGYRTYTVFCSNGCPTQYYDIRNQIIKNWPEQIRYYGWT